jgi:intracellular sulfur oxidation DsrE/DsrF family protein
MSEKAGKKVELISEAEMVPSGVVRLITLQEEGYSYLRP